MSRYINRQLVGQGGIAKVYKAFDAVLERVVALKLITPEGGEFFTAFLETEARLVAKLSHPGIVTVHDMGEDANGQKFIAMEFIDGGNAENAKGLTTRRIAEIVRDAAMAVDYAHSQGVVHRDIKPDNILLTKEGVVKVADFGLANSRHCGTPGYMAPEQMRGDKPTPADDIYSLGATLDAMLHGKPHPRLTPIIRKCMAEPKDRYQSAQSVATALNSFINQRRRKIMLSLASVVMFGVLGALGASYNANRRTETARLALNLCRRGEVLLNSENDVLGAILAFSESLKVRPDPRTYHFRGFCYYQIGAHAEAIKDAESALAFDPSNAIAIHNYRRARDAGRKAAAEAEDSATSPRRR